MTTRRTALGLAAAAVGAAALAPFGASSAEARCDLVPVPLGGGDPHLPKRDFRGLWIASVANIDWPRKPGLSVQEQQDDLIALLEVARKNNMNAIILQVRPTADTFWPSTLEPWSHWLTGAQGTDPGYDPLAFAVEQCHARGMELHAWFNPFRVAMDEAGKVLSPEHPARKHPEWVLPYGGKLYYNPGLPEVRKFSIDVIMEAVRNYDIDAVHFDDYFYPYPVAGKVFDDAAAFEKYGNGRSLADWRRANIDDLVETLARSIKQVKPHVQFGISPFGVWRNVATDAEGSRTQAGVQTYDDLYADTRRWAREGVIDYMLPQAYWSRTLAVASYENVTNWWVEQCRGANCNLYMGQATYKIGANSDKAWDDPREMTSHLEFNQTTGGVVQGNAFYNANTTVANKLDGMGIMAREWYSRPALTPRMPWIDDKAPAPVVSARRDDNVVSWKARCDAHQFVIYRVPKKAKYVTSSDLADMRWVMAVVNGDQRSWTDPEITKAYGHWTWLISAVDRSSNESSARIIG